MFHAIMTYHFKPDHLQAGIDLWRSGVADIIHKQPGFIRVQFYTQASGTAIAIGSWESEDHANAFMKTGVFADLLKSFEGMLVEAPRGSTYDLNYYKDR